MSNTKEINEEYGRYGSRVRIETVDKILNNNDVSKEFLAEFLDNVRHYRVNERTKEQFIILGLDKNYKLFNKLIAYVYDDVKSNMFAKVASNFYEELFYGEQTTKNKIDLLLYYINSKHVLTYIIVDAAYNMIFTKKEQHSPEIILPIILDNPHHFQFFYKYIKEGDKKLIFDKFDKNYYNYVKKYLTEEERKYVIQSLIKKGEIFEFEYQGIECTSRIDVIMHKNKCLLLDKLKNIYGTSYTQKTNKSTDDDEEFFLTMLNSTVLEDIYKSDQFNNNDILTLGGVLNDFDSRGIDTKIIRARIEDIKVRQNKFEKSLYRFITLYKNNPEKLEEFLQDCHITKDNYSSFIRSRKFLDKLLKESILLILSKHYKKDYISVYDIISMLQESTDRGMRLDLVLRENDINPDYFYKVFSQLKKDQPQIYDLIQESRYVPARLNKLRIKIYYSLTNNPVNDYYSFKKRFKRTPEEVLSLFEETELFDSVFEIITSWYDFKPPQDGNKEESKR